MVVQPQLDIQELEELQDDIYSFRDEFRKITYFEKKGLKNQLDELPVKLPEIDYLRILGRIFCLAREIENMKRTHMEAINKFPDNELAYYDYLASLSNATLYSESIEYGEKILEKYGNRNLVIDSMVSSFLCLGQIKKAHEYLKKLDNARNHKAYDIVSTAFSILENAKLDSDELENLYNLFFSVLNKKEDLRTIDVSIIDNCIVYRFYVELPIDEIIELNWEASCVFAENLDDMRCSVVMFEFESTNVFKERKELIGAK
jgi:tetratricopeptide (TPR) repeat protein